MVVVSVNGSEVHVIRDVDLQQLRKRKRTEDSHTHSGAQHSGACMACASVAMVVLTGSTSPQSRSRIFVP